MTRQKQINNILDKWGAIYSSDQKLTFTDLKKWNFPEMLDTTKIIAYAEKHHIYSVSQEDTHYPQKLKNQIWAPFLFYYQGDLSLLDHDILGIVWPRNPSEYASQVMQALFVQAHKFQLITASGFARGVDQQAHALSLKYQIPTIAVLWWGFQHYLKGKDREILEAIVEKWWLVISQFKFDFEPTKRSFPARNKLLAQFIDVLFLPEAQEKSWSLITTEFAFQYKKPVYSVPAPLFSQQSAGVFSKMEEKKLTLISDFSLCLTQHFPLKNKENQTPLVSQKIALIEPKLSIYNLLKQGAQSVENMLERLNLDYSVLMQELTMLEMDWYIGQSMPGVYRLV